MKVPSRPMSVRQPGDEVALQIKPEHLAFINVQRLAFEIEADNMLACRSFT